MQKDMCDLSAIPHAVNEPGMKISDCTGILNELISGQLVSFRRKRNISKRIFNLRPSVGYHALNEFPWKTADDQFIVVAKDADRSNQPCSSHSTEKSVLFYNGSTGTGFCSGRCGHKTGRTTAQYDYVIVFFYCYLSCAGNCLHKIKPPLKNVSVFFSVIQVCF